MQQGLDSTAHFRFAVEEKQRGTGEMFKTLRKIFGASKSLITTVGLVLILALCSFAQQGSTGSVSGTVTDSTGGVVPKASIKLTSELNGETRTETSNDSGDFFFGAVTPGAYTVRIDATGFRPLEQKTNMVLTSARLALGKLALEVGNVAESVEVTAQAATVATTTSSHSATIDSTQMDKIAVRGR